jgi:acyl-CoA synthetase (AMP-forming)/AMP-acid ligase II
MTFGATLGEMWERNFRLYGDVEAVVCGERRWTYATLAERARRLGAALRGTGVRQRDRVGMLAMNRGEWFDFYAGCELAGFHALTINFRLNAQEIAYILRDAAPRVLIFEAQYVELVDTIRGELPEIALFLCIGGAPDWAQSYDAFLSAGSPEGAGLVARPDDPAHLIYTSGTTGKPKGAVRSQAAGYSLAEACATSMQFRINGRGLVLMPLFHVGAQSVASGQHWCGGTIVVHRSFDPVAAARTIERERIQLTHMTPVMVRQFIETVDCSAHDFSSLETFCYAAAPMPVPLLERCIEIFGPVLYDCYGSTETGNVSVLQSHLHVLDGAARSLSRLGSVGQEHNFARLLICDDDGLELPRGTPGELCIQAGGMMDGYWNNSAATVEAFRDGWYLSGDIARMDEDGFVTLVDRKKDMIVSGGENIYCREVEEALASHADVADVAVIGVPDDRWGEAVRAIVVLREGASEDADALVAHSRSQIATYKQPRSIVFIDELPRMSTGKIDKKALRQNFAN